MPVKTAPKRPAAKQPPPTIEHEAQPAPATAPSEPTAPPPPDPSGQSSMLVTFQRQLDAKTELATTLPSHISLQKFKDAIVSAVKANPSLLTQCHPRSLFTECAKAARDGLMPDGKEGVLIPEKGGTVRWQVMAYGVRKRAKEIDGIIIDAQIVHANDEFEWVQGDDAKIEHRPLLPWKGKRGEMVAAFAIIRRFQDGHAEILHREVMDADAIARVRSYSKKPDAAMWTTLASEGWKKSVVHRAMKSVPCSPALRDILDHDNDQFDFDRRVAGPLDGPTIEGSALPMPPSISAARPAASARPSPPSSEPETAPEATLVLNVEQFITDIKGALDGAETMDEVNSIWEANERIVEHRLSSGEKARCFAHYDKTEARVGG